VPEQPDDLIVAFQAAKLLGVGHQRMYAMVRSVEIPAQRRSGRWWVKRSDLEAALERARVKTRPVIPKHGAAPEGQLRGLYRAGRYLQRHLGSVYTGVEHEHASNWA
jgi:excisionase family DNA binding protein